MLKLPSIAQVRSDVLLPLLRGDGCIALYGEDESLGQAARTLRADFDSLFLQAPIARLFDALSELTVELEKANPANIIESQTKSGVAPVEVLEIKIQYQNGCKAFDLLYESAQARVGLVRRMAGLYEALIKSQAAEVQWLQVYIEAAQGILAAHTPLPGLALANLANRVQELTAKASALELWQGRMLLAMTGCAELLDQFDRLPEGLVSKWTEVRQTPMAGYQVGPEVLELAVEAFNRLYEAMSALAACAANARDQERAVAKARAQEIAVEFALVETDLFRLRSGKWELRREARAERYVDPVSGVSWKTEDQTPEWLTGVDLQKYLVSN